MAEAIVEFDYKSDQPDELTIKKGDIITDISFVSEGWWEGTLTRLNKRGMFPDNFVKVGVFPSNFVAEITEKNTREASQRKHKTSQDETFKSSTVLTQEHTSSTNTHSLSTSKIASTSVQLTPELPVLPPKPVKELCKAIFNYEAQNSDELTLQEGDVITLITKEGQDPGWWKGELKGKIGFFPDNFVHIITPSEDVAKPDRPSKVVSTSGKAISKSATASSMSSITSISRKFSDTAKSDIMKLDEKLNHPSVSKKPVLPPPPVKKPHRSSSDLAKSPTAPNLLSSKVMDISPTSQGAASRTGSMSLITKQTNSETATNSSNMSKWSSMTETTNDNTDGALWSKQGSYTIKTENNVVSVNSGSNEPDLDMVSRAAMLTHPTASRVKAPKRRPPSAIIKDEMKNGEEEEELAVLSTTNSTTVTSTTISHTSTVISSLSSSSSTNMRTSTMLVNGDSDSHAEKPIKAPWVKELEFNQAKKSLQSGKTRVMIGGDSAVATSSTTVAPAVNSSPTAVSPESKPLGVTLRSNQGTGSNVPRPQSLIGSLRSTLSGNSNSGDSNATVSIKQFNELQEKITKMELHFESHINTLTRTVKELTSKLEEERVRRVVMQHELEKLTGLVTQV
ncbi:SH3 domain-containing kinase-binding protein 1 isoform X2 [Cimex lectularius]|uniref:SH3 domain-containing protein n=1 Tax=Cimex lectularius TaxID=79782 RepID=A0A8I6TDP4_CIMLE|nr:SH3 domain-containing kinase-binding protein 1 isoform X2 [Cimex lectularius]